MNFSRIRLEYAPVQICFNEECAYIWQIEDDRRWRYDFVGESAILEFLKKFLAAEELNDDLIGMMEICLNSMCVSIYQITAK